MTAIWYDDSTDQIWITGVGQSFAHRSLVVVRSSEMIGVRLRDRAENIVWTSYRNITDGAGLGFLSAQEAEDYLADEFAKHAAGPTGATGPRGETGPEGPPGEGVTDPGDLTLLFDNRLI